MSLSINWLKKYVDINIDPEELAHRLTMAGIAVEGVEKLDDDAILELELTPNRGDCLGLLNLAREIAAVTGEKLRIPAINLNENDETVTDYIDVDILDKDLCKRYTARVIKNVKVEPSPQWIQDALIRSGIRPINNIVDITNYVMLETNQPLHAFDYDLLGSKQIQVRRAYENETIVTLDQVERVLDNDMLVITNGSKPIALAGIMGGFDSEIQDNTTTILLESAYFLGSNIRKTSKRIGLRSDSSIRFEKGLDINGVIYALNRAAQLVQELAGGQVVEGIVDVYPVCQNNIKITLRPQRVNDILGTELSSLEIEKYLQSLSFKITKEKDVFIVEVPTYRPDIEMEVDLIEEIARLYGYDNIPDTLPIGDTIQGGLNEYQKFRAKATSVMAKYMYEVVNYSFISPVMYDNLLITQDSNLRNTVNVANPLSEEQSVMRTLLLPGLLENISRNLSRKNSNLSFFELGTVFTPKEEGLPDERLKLGAIVCGTTEVNWLKHKVSMDFYYLKGILENFFREMGFSDYEFEKANTEGYHPGRNAKVLVNKTEVGVIGEIHPVVLENFGIKESVCAFELELDKLFKLVTRKVMMESITKYPAVERDIAVLLKKNITASQAVRTIKEYGTELLRDVVVFDLYTGEQVPEEYKSMAFRLKLQASEKTLTDSEISEVVQKILLGMETSLGAKLR